MEVTYMNVTWRRGGVYYDSPDGRRVRAEVIKNGVVAHFVTLEGAVSNFLNTIDLDNLCGIVKSDDLTVTIYYRKLNS